MPELARTIVSRLRRYMGDRRHSKRRSVSLPFSLSLIPASKPLNGTRRVSSIEGHTFDLGERGLALVVPAIRLDEHHLVGENRTLNVKLELPGGPVEMQVAPVRYESLEEHQTETGYLIGARIVAMAEEDRARFSAYLATL
ncbi:MAG TPA: PilZ domain-containing protein [Pyrinomonadaceae bacterium]|nr:PilZ domain-containing protein [Pyrinomonadaceae bacterium]